MEHGYDELWLWFGLSRASWVTLPRVMMHDMPDEWQGKMAELLRQWDKTWTNQPDIETIVQIRSKGRLVKTPEWLTNYRYPDKQMLESIKHSANQTKHGKAY